MNEWDAKEITLLTPYIIRRAFFIVVRREIEDFAIAHVNLYEDGTLTEEYK